MWLDFETQAILHNSSLPPQKHLAADRFSVVVLFYGGSLQGNRLLRGYKRASDGMRETADDYLARRLPFVFRQEISLNDAMLAQFELICCDIVSVFLSDDLVNEGDPQYLADLYNSLVRSPEFEDIDIAVNRVPDDASGKNFVEQFLGAGVEAPVQLVAARKKARIMSHWGTEIGAEVSWR